MRTLAIAVFCSAAACAATPYFKAEEMPDLVKCLPPPPAADSPAFLAQMEKAKAEFAAAQGRLPKSR